MLQCIFESSAGLFVIELNEVRIEFKLHLIQITHAKLYTFQSCRGLNGKEPLEIVFVFKPVF